MPPDHYRQLFAYDDWASRRVWDCLERLTNEQFTTDLHYSVGSLRIQAAHTLTNQSFWVGFLMTGERRFVDFDEFPTRPVIRQAWDQVHRETRDYVATLNIAELNRMVLPDHWAKRDRTPFAVWQGLSQIINHNTDHRAQILAGIHRLGGETVAQDDLTMLREHEPRNDQPEPDPAGGRRQPDPVITPRR